MVASADSRIASDRFAQYVAELREFSSSHLLPCGAPQHLPVLLDRLNNSPAFRAECTSMLRAVFYREHGHAPPEDLLLLMIVAWAGHPAGPPTLALQSAIADLRRFAAGIMRTPVAPPELQEEPASDNDLPAETPQLQTEPPHSAVVPGEVEPNALPLNGSSRHAAAESPNLQLLAPAPSPPQLVHPSSNAPQDTPLTALERIESAIQLLAIRSPDVKHYLELLKYRDIQIASDQRRIAERAAQLQLERRHADRRTNPQSERRVGERRVQQQSRRLPAQSAKPPALEATPAPQPPRPARYDPWDENSEFQIELRRFAAEREARLSSHHQSPPADHSAEHSAWTRLLARFRHT